MNMTKTKQSYSVCEHFKIRYSPFSDTFPINEAFMPQRDERMQERIMMLLGQGKSFSLTGEPGSGKSMFLKHLVNTLEGKSFRTVQIPYSGLKPQGLLREICEKLSIDTSGRGALLTRINKALSREREGGYVVLILDEAHLLPRESLMELFSITSDSNHRTASASVILCGHPVLEKTLALDIHAAIRTRLACRFQIRPLLEEEIKGFLEFRLKAAGIKEPLFTPEAMYLLGLDSKGNRRQIMNLAGNCLDLATIRGEQLISEELVREVCDQA